MPLIQYAPVGPACQVDGMPVGTKEKPFIRSGEGSVHFRPGSTQTITADELEFVKKERPDVFRHIRVLVEDKATPAEPAPAPQPPPEGSGGSGDDKPSKSGKGSKG